jgi:pimeloyl-ACP methyl ester carboxylesterase
MEMPAVLRPVEVHEQRGRYTVQGDGPPLVLLATPLALARTYRPTIEKLARSFRVVTVEMPGSGGGSRLSAPWDMEAYASWAAGVLDVLSIEDSTVVGHSFSGGVGLVLAALHPAKVGRLVLADTVGGVCPHSLSRVLVGRAVDALVEARLTLGGWHHVAFNALAHTRNFFSLVSRAAAADLSGYAREVHAPTLLAWGARDYTTPMRCATALRTVMPDARLYVSEQGSHDWIIGRPDEFAAAVAGFVRDAPAPGQAVEPLATKA